jgi:hypothetical protein
MLSQIPFAAVEFAANPEPRCPCVLVLDTSASMAGAKLQELQRGLTQLKDELSADPLARKRVELAVITFGGSVRLHGDFATVDAFEPPLLRADGLTPMGRRSRPRSTSSRPASPCTAATALRIIGRGSSC